MKKVFFTAFVIHLGLFSSLHGSNKNTIVDLEKEPPNTLIKKGESIDENPIVFDKNSFQAIRDQIKHKVFANYKTTWNEINSPIYKLPKEVYDEILEYTGKNKDPLKIKNESYAVNIAHTAISKRFRRLIRSEQNLYQFKITPNSLRSINKIGGLKSLSDVNRVMINNIESIPENVDFKLKYFKFVKHLEIFSCDFIKNSALKDILLLKNLKTISLNNLIISDLTPLKNVPNISLTHCFEITDLTPIKNVISLYIMFSTSITDVSCLKKIRSLTLEWYTSITNLVPLPPCLKKLKLIKVALSPKIGKSFILESLKAQKDFENSLKILQKRPNLKIERILIK